MIPFNKPFISDEVFAEFNKFKNDPDLLKNRYYMRQCLASLQALYTDSSIRLTKSCTQALELSALLMDIRPGDEIVMPSFSYVSLATSYALRGAEFAFVDIDPDTLNIDPEAVGHAISPRTRAIVAINYSGIAAEYDALRDIAAANRVPLIEDNAMGIGGFYKGKPLGTLGDIGTMSFDYLKNISCGEGGALLINNPVYEEALNMIYENGTNKTDFIDGKVDKYEWRGLGSNYYLSEILSCILYKQLQTVQPLTTDRLAKWNYYQSSLSALEQKESIELLRIPEHCRHNGHNFIIKVRDETVRASLMQYLKGRDIESAFHYTPLHSSAYGRRAGRFIGEDRYTTRDSLRLLRLPLFYDITREEQDEVIGSVHDFFSGKK